MTILSQLFPAGLPGPSEGFRFVSGAGQRFDGLLDWAQLEQILAHACFDGTGSAAIGAALDIAAGPSRVCVLRNGNEVWRAPRWLDAEGFRERLRGATLRVEAIEEVHAPIEEALASRLRSLAPATYINAYAAWGSSAGLALHYDYTDIIVLQLEGQKQWQIYRPTREPIRGSESRAYKDALQAADAGESNDLDELRRVEAGLVWEGMLTAGDALYLAPGWFHRVRSVGSPTLHLACAFRAPAGPGDPPPCLRLPDALR
jgi:hypothetical protein